MNFTCNDCEDEIHDEFHYEVSLTTEKEELKIGDTLRFSTVFPSKVELASSKMIHDNSEQYVDYRFHILELERGKTKASPARESFRFVNLDAGTVHIPEARAWEAEIHNFCGPDTCRLAFGIVPKREGFFGVFLRKGFLGAFECMDLTLFPSRIKSDVGSNTTILEELELSNIKTDFLIDNPDSDELLYLFKVRE
ncbi:MAG: hypothetical protein AAGA77_16605 [Bacteroidota bacterium]